MHNTVIALLWPKWFYIWIRGLFIMILSPMVSLCLAKPSRFYFFYYYLKYVKIKNKNIKKIRQIIYDSLPIFAWIAL